MGNGRGYGNQFIEKEITKEVKVNLFFGKNKTLQVTGKGKGKYEYKAIENAEKDVNLKINKEIKKIIKQHLSEIIREKLLNIPLLVTKYISIIIEEEEKEKKDKKQFKINLIDKKDLLDFILKNQNYIFSLKQSNWEKLSSFSKNHKTYLEGFNKVIDNETIATSSRLVCGLGSANVLETAITLHHLYGIPYIPGSSFKGVCREVVFHRLVENKNITEDKLDDFQNKFYGELYPDDEDILTYQLLFGAQNFKGLLLFLDAYPENNQQQIFDLDIMNPHYSKYYGDKSGNVVPGDWENPVPIFFLTVRKGVKFKFNLFFDRWRWEKIKEDSINFKEDKKTIIIKFHDKDFKKECKEKECVYFINTKKVEEYMCDNNFYKDIITQALCFSGIGSKRSSGYGIFSVSDKA